VVAHAVAHRDAIRVSAKAIATLDVHTRAAWHAWLEKHHGSASEIWLVFHKQHTGAPGVGYEDSIEEALCFGWVDSLVRRLDDDRYARKFTPRKPGSAWSVINRRRYASLAQRGLLQEAGRVNAPGTKVAIAPPRGAWATLPKYIERALKESGAAWRHFEQLAPSYRRKYIGWIDSAKRDDTKERRLREAVGLLAKGKKLGLK
jgi:uncharacterized protein YdeI (YjbR/CyaY-like superfamily)